MKCSRETLQENAVFGNFAKQVTQKVLDDLIQRAKDDPEQYKRIYKEHGKQIKLGFNDHDNHSKYLELLRFDSLNNTDPEKLISFREL